MCINFIYKAKDVIYILLKQIISVLFQYFHFCRSLKHFECHYICFINSLAVAHYLNKTKLTESSTQ